jgi:Subtilase family
LAAFGWILQNALTPEANVRLAAVNMSIGAGRATAPCDRHRQKPLIGALRNVGVATILSSGNLGYVDAVGNNACISAAIAVGSSTKENSISYFSNMSEQVALMAPGGFGTGNDCDLVDGDNRNILSSVSGTSAAANNAFGCKAAVGNIPVTWTVQSVNAY